MSDSRTIFIVIVLVASLVLSFALALRSRAGIAMLALLSVLWLLVNHDFEGPVLVVFSHTHGLTASDLVGVVGLLTAGWLLWRRRR